MAVSIISSVGCPASRPNPATAPATAMITSASLRPSAFSRFSSGVDSGSAVSVISEMRPSSVCCPVATTTASPEPCAMVVPL